MLTQNTKNATQECRGLNEALCIKGLDIDFL